MGGAERREEAARAMSNCGASAETPGGAEEEGMVRDEDVAVEVVGTIGSEKEGAKTASDGGSSIARHARDGDCGSVVVRGAGVEEVLQSWMCCGVSGEVR